MLAAAAPQEGAGPLAAAAKPVAGDPPASAPSSEPASAAGEPGTEAPALTAAPQIPKLDAAAAAAIIVTEGVADSAEAPAEDQPAATVPAPKPKPPAPKAEAPDADAPKVAVAAGNGRIARSVTFRSGPGGAAMGTIRAGTEVKVISCGAWCEIVHDGRKGFIYKSFLQRD